MLRPPTRRLAFAWLLACALVFAQGLGLAHRVAHGGAESRTGWAGHAPADVDCQLYDHQASGDAAVAPLVVAVVAEPCAPALAPAPAGRVPAPVPAYEARGPPRA